MTSKETPKEERIETPMPPRGNAPKLNEIKISVPAGTLTEAGEMAHAMGLSPGEFNRMAWILGVHALAQGDNKLKVNRSLRQKQSATEEE
jgi:hypothetical protein